MSGSRAFWAIFMLLCAVGAHLAYVLFVPSNQMQGHIDDLIAGHGLNTLVIADGDNAAGQLATYRHELAYAVCIFDLSNGPVKVVAEVPDQFWSIELYNLRGATLYTLDDRQTKRRQLTFIVRQDEPDAEALVSASRRNLDGSGAIAILAGTGRGILMLRSAAANWMERERAIAAFRNSSCESVAG